MALTVKNRLVGPHLDLRANRTCGGAGQRPEAEGAVPALRAFVARALADSPRRDDAVVIASELAANALRHLPAERPAAEVISVWVATGPGWARIEVRDRGTGRWQRTLSADEDEEWRGLALCEQLSDRIGHQGGPGGQSLWAELTWPD